jgi:PIN domain nuclease of toxin-antitoxin system
METRMTDDPMAPALSDLAPRKLTHLQARAEQRLYWSRKSPADRLVAATALTKRSYSLLGIDLDERKADLTPRRVSRRQG